MRDSRRPYPTQPAVSISRSAFPPRLAQAFEEVLEHGFIAKRGRCTHRLLGGKSGGTYQKLRQRFARFIESAELAQRGGEVAPSRRKLRPPLYCELCDFGRLRIVACQVEQHGLAGKPEVQIPIVGAEADRRFDRPKARLGLAA